MFAVSGASGAVGGRVAACLSCLVHIQNRCRVRRYSGSYETSDLRPFTVGHRKRAAGKRTTLLRGLRHAPSPDHPCQQQGRAHLADSPLAGMRLPDGARCHPRLQKTWLGCSLVAGSSPPKQTHRAFEEERSEALWESLHQDPRKFGKEEIPSGHWSTPQR